MILIDGDKIVTAQLYNDEYEEYIEEKMSIIDYVNAYTNEGVTTADDVLDKIRAEIEPKCDRINSLASKLSYPEHREIQELLCEIMDLCKAESEDKECI